MHTIACIGPQDSRSCRFGSDVISNESIQAQTLAAQSRRRPDSRVGSQARDTRATSHVIHMCAQTRNAITASPVPAPVPVGRCRYRVPPSRRFVSMADLHCSVHVGSGVCWDQQMMLTGLTKVDWWMRLPRGNHAIASLVRCEQRWARSGFCVQAWLTCGLLRAATA